MINSWTPYEESPDGHRKICIWHSPKHSLPLLHAICKQQEFKLYEEAILWLIEQYEHRPWTWEATHCLKPRFWFGQRLLFVPQKKVGIVRGIEWRENSGLLQHGFWYRMKWDGRESLQGVHENSLEAL
ncbi:hypothetical protein [Iningainema tapete]|uniref:Uncharacterized protein n=1 Tax=Iningainema tapete BLCC-T55 TaxID=2748662 RepID=A0A8J6XEN0_9CYAN|nr:hypothetical protein [Iningainema tapete]MBD2771192.1 hypothetical protein [Iningainema tapete BLCC-T55]